MESHTREEDDVLVMELSGKLDTQTSGPASEEMAQIAESGHSKVLLRLDKLEFVSSAGLRVILRTAKLVKAAGGSLRLCNASGLVKEVMEISGFDSLLDMHDTEANALEAF